jgi:hypothetical protein
MSNTTTSSSGDFPWLPVLGLAGAGFTVYRAVKGEKIAPLILIGAVLTIARFIIDS